MPFESSRLTFIVDDNAHYHQIFRTAFEEVRPKNRVEYFFSGQALLEKLSDPSKPLPDLILLDLHMPTMNGITTLGRIKQSIRLVKIPTLIMTASDHDTDLWQSYQAGANAFIHKPSTLKEFKRFVEVTCRYWLDVAQVPTYSQEAY